MNRIAIIGNGGGGKTTLARALGHRWGLTVTHVDSIQFLPGLSVRPVAETTAQLNTIADGDAWVIDGFGSLDVMRRRFERAEQIIFVDFPLWRHYWWCTKRQLKSIVRPRAELPEGCNEATFARTIELYRTLWRVHTKIRPKLLEMFAEPSLGCKVVVVKNLREWRHVVSPFARL